MKYGGTLMSICLRVYGYLKRVVFAGDFMPI